MSKRLITVRSGKEEIQMEVTEEEYQRYLSEFHSFGLVTCCNRFFGVCQGSVDGTEPWL